MWLLRIILYFAVIYLSEGIIQNFSEKVFFCLNLYFLKCVIGIRKCPETSKAHLTRCDMYYKCEMLPSDNFIWIPKNCPNGLIYDSVYRVCVLPGKKN